MPSFSVDLQVYEQGRRRPEYTLDTDLDGEVTLADLLEWTKASLIVIADQVLKEEQEAGFDKNPVVAVDGRIGKPVSAVNPLGQIEITARADIYDVVYDAYEAVMERSKVLTGRYKSSNLLFLNGVQIASSPREFQAWFAFTSPQIKNGDTFRLVNIQPYARRLERYGVTAQRSNPRVRQAGTKKKPKNFTVRVPNGTYALAARAIRAKYKRNSQIKFTFLPGSSLGLTGTFKSAGRAGKNSAGRPYLYPTISITVSDGGTL